MTAGLSESVEDTLEVADGTELVSDRIADLVEYLVVNIVDDVDAVSLEVIDSESSSAIEVSVAADDVAKVIGRHGRTIKAIRTLARALAARLGTSVEIEVLG
ncbi:KH domain-containing protein [Collinsella phocaeensis]|uniref:KH domain-containing protein n=1 Tax=Collinsella phocaeensis TaxID=1871016 RepID=UPI0009F91723|nr:KH domain-containing protein [Collinsella phocaeensis]